MSFFRKIGHGLEDVGKDVAIGAGAVAEAASRPPRPVVVETVEGPLPVVEDEPVFIREPVIVAINTME